MCAVLTFPALVARARKQPQDEPQLKIAAAMGETEELQEILGELWKVETMGSDEYALKVLFYASGIEPAKRNARKSIFLSQRPTKHHWNHST